MKLHIILSLILFTMLTGCVEKNKNLIETESELVQNHGNAQICVYNDEYIDHGKKKNYTYIDIIKDNEVKETVNTYRYLDKVTDIDCFDFNDDKIKDIALIGYSGTEANILLYESTSDYHYTVFSGWSDVASVIMGTLGEDFPMKRIEALLDNWSPGYIISDEVLGMFDAENWSYKADDYKEAYAAIARLLGPEYESAQYALVDIDGKEPLEFVISSSETIALFNYGGGSAHRFLLGNAGNEYEYSPGKNIIRCSGKSTDAVYYKNYMPVLEGFKLGDNVAFLECHIKDFDGDGEITEKDWEMTPEGSDEVVYDTWYENWSENEMSDDVLKKLVDGYSALDYKSLFGYLKFDELLKEL